MSRPRRTLQEGLRDPSPGRHEVRRKPLLLYFKEFVIRFLLIVLILNRYCRPDKRNKLPRWVQAASHSDGALRNENLSTAEAVNLARVFLRASAQPMDPAAQRAILLDKVRSSFRRMNVLSPLCIAHIRHFSSSSSSSSSSCRRTLRRDSWRRRQRRQQ